MKDKSKHHNQQTTAPAPHPQTGKQTGKKKPFVKPKITRHQDLPEVTTGFVGTYNP